MTMNGMEGLLIIFSAVAMIVVPLTFWVSNTKSGKRWFASL